MEDIFFPIYIGEHRAGERDALRRLVADYQRLSIIRLRDAIVGVPVLGGVARRTARWLGRSTRTEYSTQGEKRLS
jgi:hypothetical protein